MAEPETATSVSTVSDAAPAKPVLWLGSRSVQTQLGAMKCQVRLQRVDLVDSVDGRLDGAAEYGYARGNNEQVMIETTYGFV